jgi:formiminotetrahydrofolate cyclodeaminase
MPEKAKPKDRNPPFLPSPTHEADWVCGPRRELSAPCLRRLSNSRVDHTLSMAVSVWATSVESLYQELTLPKPAPASVVAAAVTARMGIALLIKTLAVVGNRNSFEGEREKLKTLTEAAQRESSKLAEAAEDDVTGAPERKRSEVPMNAALAAEAALVLCAEARAIATGSIAVDIEIAVMLLTAAHRSVLMCVGSNLRET